MTNYVKYWDNFCKNRRENNENEAKKRYKVHVNNNNNRIRGTAFGKNLKENIFAKIDFQKFWNNYLTSKRQKGVYFFLNESVPLSILFFIIIYIFIVYLCTINQ